MANIGCEICGADNACTVPAPSGGTMDACQPCEADEIRQAEIDTNWERMLNTPLIPLPA
ncbi:hypothetical protein [Micromonospora sp. NBRC 107095]|uniref:hypothetical protein n=1 Tax=Micromonospora sp. NBRC 107095 TaxID=3032209 RepID=UPI0024A230B1|nr:hypothetical protein [Micromonospora sp. NBRC 107095]GLZ62891.1 hypothetical protein Misp05_64670 [Micromonospora sp. NBRC 107095]